jgi:tRNA (guanine37-N1)-methyltransferase
MPESSLGIKVHKTCGQRTIILAGKLGLLNRQLEIKRLKDFVYVPLVRRPSRHESEELQSQVGENRVSNYVFHKKPKRVSSLADLLDGKLAPQLMASSPRSLDIVGDVAIVEIPPELRSHRTIIGEAILKLNKNVNTVLAKEGAVSGTYRLREHRIIAGKPQTTTVHREHGCQYYVDPIKAYFSPRLSFEHQRVASLVREGESVLDMFTGIGPFAVLIAKSLKSVRVYAVDANPHAVEFLKKNIRLNRVEYKVIPILGDAEEVVKHRLSGLADRVIMNLPGRAARFLCAACLALKPCGGVIHFYGFLKASDTLRGAQTGFVHAVEQCGRKVSGISYSRLVRATAPHEWQFVIDAQIAGASRSG